MNKPITSKPRIRRTLQTSSRRTSATASPFPAVIAGLIQNSEFPINQEITSAQQPTNTITPYNQPIVIVDNDKDNQDCLIVDLTKDVDSDIAVIHGKRINSLY